MLSAQLVPVIKATANLRVNNSTTAPTDQQTGHTGGRRVYLNDRLWLLWPLLYLSPFPACDFFFLREPAMGRAG